MHENIQDIFEQKEQWGWPYFQLLKLTKSQYLKHSDIGTKIEHRSMEQFREQNQETYLCVHKNLLYNNEKMQNNAM